MLKMRKKLKLIPPITSLNYSGLVVGLGTISTRSNGFLFMDALDSVVVSVLVKIETMRCLSWI
jgi:hypothetical protein